MASKLKKKIIDSGYKIRNSRYFSKLFGSYKITWEMAGVTKNTAMDAVLRGVKDEEEFWRSGKKEAEKLKNFVNKNSVVLDVGCGMGRIEKSLAQYCKEIHGVDISGRMIRFAKNNLKEHKMCFVYKNNGKDLSIFKDNKFDFVFSIITLQHLEKEDAYAYISEMCRVLKPEGKVYLQLPNFLSDIVFETFIKYVKSGSRHITRVRGYTVSEVEKMMGSVGFDDLKMMVEEEYIICIGLKGSKR